MAGRTTRAAARAAAAKTPLTELKEHERISQQLSSPPATPLPTRRTGTRRPKPVPLAEGSRTQTQKKQPPTSSTQRKRKRGADLAAQEDINDLPHNLGKILLPVKTEPTANDEEAQVNGSKASGGSSAQGLPSPSEGETKPIKTRQKRVKAELSDPAVVAAAKELADQAVADSPEDGPKKRAKKAKANPYGLTPGISPFPDWPHPTPEECQEVNDLLAKVHGEVKAPERIPAPSTTVSGCGEVPSILDALIRTLLSAATTGANSSRAFQGLVKTFGLLEGGVGRGSVNWDRVRRADVKEVFEAIKSGGLAATKSKRIKEILDMVHQENMARRDALLKAEKGEDEPGPPGAENESRAEKDKEIARANEHVLSLDHLHALSSDDALNALIKYPGIGPKTASCVLLFCMQRPSFAVDTHVFRLCRWLDWIPEKATRNSAYSHCEVRVPDHLKYPLHQLLIRHGKTCPRCRAATGVGSEGWDKGCPIDHLVKRTGKRKTGVSGPAKAGKRNKKKKTVKREYEGSDEEDEGATEASSDLTDIDEPVDEDGDEEE